MTNSPRLLLLAAILQLSLAGAVSAASPSPAISAAAPGTDSTQPQSTTATYGDWTLRCVVRQSPAPNDGAQPAAPSVRQCEVDQAIEIKGQAGPVAQVAMGFDPTTGVSRLVAQVPVGAWLPAGVTVHVGTAPPVALGYKRCLPSSCLADVDIPAALDTTMRSGGAGGLTFQMVAGKDVTVPLSFKGFKAASDALSKAIH